MLLTWSGGTRNNPSLGQQAQFIDMTAFVSAGGTSLLASPSSLSAGSTNNLVTLTGGNTTWTPGTPGTPTFTLSSTGTGASIVSQVVNSATSATLTINAGTIGVITITDPSTGDTATIAVQSSVGIGAPGYIGLAGIAFIRPIMDGISAG